MADDDFFPIQENDPYFPLSDLYEEPEEKRPYLQGYGFEIPSQLFLDLKEAEISYDIMMNVSEKLSFAYQDLIRKIEVIS